MHSELRGIIPLSPTDTERAALQVDPDDIGYDRWSYVAMGEYHVYRPLAPNASYSGALEYTSFNVWGELHEEKEGRVRGKGIVEYDLEARKRVFHPLTPARQLVDLPLVSGRGVTAADVDAAIRRNVEILAWRYRGSNRQAGRDRHPATRLAGARPEGTSRVQAAAHSRSSSTRAGPRCCGRWETAPPDAGRR